MSTTINRPLKSLFPLCLLLLSCEASAHPLDSYAIDQYMDFRLRQGEILLLYRIEFAEIPTAAELPQVDKNRDLILTDDETVPYVEKNVRVLLEELELEVEGKRIEWSDGGGSAYLETMPAPRLRLVNRFTASIPEVPSDGLKFRFRLRHEEKARGDRQTRLVCEGPFGLGGVRSSETVQPPGMAPPFIGEATALVYGHEVVWSLYPAGEVPAIAVQELGRKRDVSPSPPSNPFLSLNDRGFDETLVQPETTPLPVTAGSTRQEESDLQKVALPQYAEGKTEKETKETWADKKFRQLMASNNKTSFSFMLIASILALVYGAAHALEPGHGKTIVGAYLVGAHGTVFHAVLLALIVTFTHTFSVYILGIVALTNLERVQGTFLPVLECGSWGLIVLMGVYLFLKYFKYYVSGQLADPTFHTHGFGSGHSHAPGGHSHDHRHSRDLHHSHGHHDHHHHDLDHSHPQALEHHHHEEHPAHHPPPTHSHTHHPHDHVHSHSHKDEDEGSRQVSFWNLLVLGMTGGIVPCPGALFVMMMALGSSQAAFGLYLITLFSIGLALTLMTVGIVMVKGRGVMDRYSPNSKFIQVLPVLSSLVIIFVGAGFLLNALVKHGILTVHL